jgi:hypothetical protein
LCVYTLSKTLLSRLLDIFFFFKTIPNPPAAFATQQTILKTFHPKFWGPSSLSMDVWRSSFSSYFYSLSHLSVCV